MSQLLYLLGMAGIGIVMLNLLFYAAQPGIVFHPIEDLAETPSDWGMEFEDVHLESEDGIRLHGWYIPAPNAGRVLVFLHGNAGNISHRRDPLRIFHDLGLDVFIVDYRGFGRSQGQPSEEGLYMDAFSAWHYLTEQRGIEAQDIVVFGRSLGGAVAAQLASRVKPAAVIIESSFSSAADASRLIYPLLSPIVLLRYHFLAADHLARADTPILIMHSPADRIVPIGLGRHLYQRAPEPKRFVELSGGHNDGFLRSMPYYAHELAAFLASPELQPDRTTDAKIGSN